MIILKNKFLVLFLFLFFIIGSLNSLKNGISMDEIYENENWKIQKKISINILNHFIFKKPFDNKFQETFESNFLGYGIGFQIVSQPIQYFLKDLLITNKSITEEGALVLSKHFVVFLFFFISGIFFYLILRKILENEIFCSLGLIIYLTYPYLYGQSLFSPKDAPFMSVWVMCTYFNFFIFEKLFSNNKISILQTLSFSFLTAFLFSIRIAGILILLQYFIALTLYLNLSKPNLFDFIKKYFTPLIIFLLSLITFTYLLHPPFWLNPSLIFDTISTMSNYHNNVGTNTYGKVMYATDLPSTYLLIWFVVKLPLLILVGIFLLPFSEKKYLSIIKYQRFMEHYC